jgi:hypothetical protein
MAQARIVSYELWQTVKKDELVEKMRSRKIPKAMLDPRYDVNIYDVMYVSHWHDGSEVLASGLYFVPQGVEAPMPQVVYHHGTVMQKGRQQEVKGEANLCLGYAVEGYLVLMPDYIGLGNGERFHLYQDYRSLATSAVDILMAVRQLDTTLRVKASEQLFLTGYSEGGYAALGTNKFIQEQYADRFKVTATSANAGAYDMAGVQSQAMFQPYHRPQFLPFLLMGVNEVYRIAPDVHDLYRPPYDSLVRVFFDGTHDGEVMTPHFPSIAVHMLKDWVLEDYRNNASSPFRRALADNTITHWRPDNPVQLCHCKGDETVFYGNALVALEGMRQSGATDVTLRNPGRKYGHRSCAIFTTGYSKFYFDSFLPGAKHGRKGSSTQRFLMGLLKLKKPVTK